MVVYTDKNIHDDPCGGRLCDECEIAGCPGNGGDDAPPVDPARSRDNARTAAREFGRKLGLRVTPDDVSKFGGWWVYRRVQDGRHFEWCAPYGAVRLINGTGYPDEVGSC